MAPKYKSVSIDDSLPVSGAGAGKWTTVDLWIDAHGAFYPPPLPPFIFSLFLAIFLTLIFELNF